MRMGVTGRTRVLGIIGSPVRHSLSPLMHNAAAEALGLDYIYVPFPVPSDQLASAVAGLRHLGIAGFSVTIPFKSGIIPLLDRLSPEAEMAGAVNAVNAEEGQLVGYNTDGLGLVKSLAEDLHFVPAGSRILMLGAGGAARGALAALGVAGAESITVANRTMSSSEALISFFAGIFPHLQLATGPLDILSSGESLKQFDLIINTTSVGMNGTSFAGFSRSSLTGGNARFYDMVYAPAETPFLAIARSCGLPAANGLGMLAAQGELAFAIWTGVTPPSGLMKDCLMAVTKGYA